MTRIDLHATEKEGRCHPASFEGACHPEQIIPGTRDQVLIDRPFEQRFDMLVGLGPIHTVEPLLAQVANTWRELQAEQVEEGKEHFGISGGIRGMARIRAKLGHLIHIPQFAFAFFAKLLVERINNVGLIYKSTV